MELNLQWFLLVDGFFTLRSLVTRRQVGNIMRSSSLHVGTNFLMSGSSRENDV